MSTVKVKSARAAIRSSVLERIKFGSVTIAVCLPSAVEIKHNIKAGQAALFRARHKFLTPGVKISVSKGVPLFSVDPDNPTLLVRKLNGRIVRGVFSKKGRFKVCQ